MNSVEQKRMRLTKASRAGAWRAVSFLIIIALCGAGVWASGAKLDEVAIAEGEVKPQGKVRTIQHLEGGIVKQIMVKEGQEVEPDQPLVQVALARSQANREELQFRILGMRVTAARHAAELAGKKPEFPQEAVDNHPEMVATEFAAFENDRREYLSKLRVLRSQLRQRDSELVELTAKRRAISGNVAIATKRLEISAGLLKKKLIPKLEHLDLEAKVIDLKGQLDATAKSIPRARAAIAEAKDRLTNEEDVYRRNASNALAELEKEIGRLDKLLNEATDQELRTTIRSPIRGVVKNLTANTIGGVIRPGERIMEIVPVNETLVVMARLNPVDRGYVRLEQNAQVKISAYDFFQFGALDGKVIQIAADANRGPEGQPYFEVVVETKGGYRNKRGEDLIITPGMQATVDIHTGTTPVLTYLLKPFLRLKHEGFRER